MTIYFIFKTEKTPLELLLFICCLCDLRDRAVWNQRTVFEGSVLVCEMIHVSERGCVRVYLVAG